MRQDRSIYTYEHGRIAHKRVVVHIAAVCDERLGRERPIVPASSLRPLSFSHWLRTDARVKRMMCVRCVERMTC